MVTDDFAEVRITVSEAPEESSGFCSECRSVTFFMYDEKLGYYKQCPNCGNIEYLQRRFLRFDRQSRQWT